MTWTKTLFLLATAGPAAINAHTLFTNFFVDGVDQGDGTCLRLPQHPNNATFPQPSITAPSMACGFDGEIGASRTCPVQPGSSLSLEFRDWPDGSKPGSIDISHKGPCSVYMKKVDDATANNTAAGDGWFRIFYQDYDAQSKKWCTEKLIDNSGRLTVALPKDVAGGNYLLRSELLALHQADKNPPDPQFYISCAQIFMNSTSTAVPKDTVSIPGYVNLNMPAMTFNIWKQPMALPYPGYGPAIYQDGDSKTTTKSSSPSPSSTSTSKHRRYPPVVSPHRRAASLPQQTTGLKPASCVLAAGNWCGLELSPYSTQDGCWNASTACWKQNQGCWDTVGPTGGKNCRIWEAKCKGVQAACSAKNFNGPPDAGKDLNPPLRKVQLPAVYAMNSPANVGNDTAGTQASGKGSGVPVITTVVVVPVPAATKAAAAQMVDGVGSVSACGSSNSIATCANGLCCSAHGWCGSGMDYCGEGCQAAFGSCVSSY